MSCHAEPSAPTNLVLVEELTTDVSLYVMWDTPDSDGGSPITGYRVRTENVDTFETENNFIGVVNAYNITGLTPFNTYTILVGAINENGRGEQASVVGRTLSESKSNIVHVMHSFSHAYRYVYRELLMTILTHAELDIIFNQFISRTATTIHFRFLVCHL